MAKIWRILAIDGGGIRGLVPATFLSVIEERTGKPIAQLFDIIAGTSTGGILALGLTKPDQCGCPQFSARQLRDLYERDAPQIFHNPASWWENLLRPKYVSTSGISRIMRQNLGDTRLKDAVADILIPCYDIEHRSPHIFKSRWARRQAQYDFSMSDVACAAAATPTMFEPMRLARPGAGGHVSLVDGGVFANNPALLAFAEINKMFASEGDRFLVVSLGTGESMERMKRKYVTDWGYVRWSIPMIELVSESGSEAVHEQMRYLLPPTDYQRYYRFQVDLPDDVYYALDNPSQANMAGLIAAAEELLADPQTEHEMSMLCQMLLPSKQEQCVQFLEGVNQQPAATVSLDNLVPIGLEAAADAAELLSGAAAQVQPLALQAGAATTELMRHSALKRKPVALVAAAQSGKRASQLAGKARTARNGRASAVRSAPVGAQEDGAAAVGSSPYQYSPAKPSRIADCQVVLCYAGEDIDVARPLADALKERGITTVFEKFGSQPTESIRRLVSHAAETSLITIVVLSPSLLKNRWASKQLEWLYSRTLSGKNVILPVIHRFGKADVWSLARHLHWHKAPAKYLTYLMDLAEGSTAHGIGPLADRLAEDMYLWFS